MKDYNVIKYSLKCVQKYKIILACLTNKSKMMRKKNLSNQNRYNLNYIYKYTSNNKL